jgi:RNA polymerase sigma factor (TIGR02999 family)
MLSKQGGVKLSAPMADPQISHTQITALLRAWSDGERQASDDLIRAVYDELRRQARRQLRHERQNHTLDTAALINETYLKLVEQRPVKWHHRGHFFALAAELMRRILVDYARTRQRQKRGGVNDPITLDEVFVPHRAIALPANVDLIALDEALHRLAAKDEQQVRIVELRFFAGLDIAKTAEVLEISTATVNRDWAAAKAWLRNELTRKARL